MGKLIYSLNVSLDGFVETPDHSLDWAIVDEELHAWFNDQTRTLDASLYGRRMYELMAGYWPTAGDDPSATDAEREFARIWKPMPKIVFSTSLEHVEHNSRLVSGDVAKCSGPASRVRRRPGRRRTEPRRPVRASRARGRVPARRPSGRARGGHAVLARAGRAAATAPRRDAHIRLGCRAEVIRAVLTLDWTDDYRIEAITLPVATSTAPRRSTSRPAGTSTSTPSRRPGCGSSSSPRPDRSARSPSGPACSSRSQGHTCHLPRGQRHRGGAP